MSFSPRAKGRSSRREDDVAAHSSSDDETSARDRRKNHRPRDDRHRSRHRESRRDLSVDDYNSKRSSRHERSRRERSRSRSRSPYRRRSRSPPAKKRRSSYRESKSPLPQRSRAPLPSQDASFRGDAKVAIGGEALPEKQKPNYKPTGLLAKEANTVQGTTTVLKYHEPPEARKPSSKAQWRMYVFKKKDLLDTIYLYQRSAWLMGRDEKVTDMHLEHPSISKQHAVIQFRYITTTNKYGDKQSAVKPYLIDLDSANGTKLNGERIEGSRFVELVDQDVVSFGDSKREYVMMLPSGEA